MNRTIISLLFVGLFLFLPVSLLHGEDTESKYENRIEYVNDIDIDVMTALVDLANSIERSKIEQCYKEITEMQSSCQMGDTLRAAQIFALLPKTMASDDYFVVVNEKYERQGPGFTIYLLPEGSNPNEFCTGSIWPVEQVRKYGFLKYGVLEYRVLLVDLESGRDYFTLSKLDKNLPHKVYEILSKYRDELPILSYENCISAEQLTEESGRVFIYNDVDGRLVNISGPLPMLKAIDRGTGIRHPRSE